MGQSESGPFHQPSASGRRQSALFVVLTALLVSLLPGPPARGAISPSEFEECLLESINADREAAGWDDLGQATELTGDLRAWSAWMSDNDFRHMTSAERDGILPARVLGWGENIAWWGNANLPDCSSIHDLLMSSDGHRANILKPNFTAVGLGAHVDESGWWVIELFLTCVGTFCDDDSSPFEADIEKIAAAGITNGCGPPSTTRYCPDGHVTRGAMAAFLVRALDLPSGSSIDFVDDDNSPFEADIEKIAAAGITNGCNPPASDRYCPDDPVTREEMAALLARALPLPGPGTVDFVDDDDSPFETPIERLAAAGITNGCEPERYCPDDYVTRAAMAAFLARALDL